jgi:hypothetical protein
MTVTNYPVSSSAIARIDYDDEEQVVYLTFQKGGGMYVIEGVPQIEVERWSQSGSPGGYWNSYLKGRY